MPILLLANVRISYITSLVVNMVNVPLSRCTDDFFMGSIDLNQ